MDKLVTMKRNSGSKLLALLPLVLMVFATGPAFAQSPHFVSASASGPSSDGTLNVSFKEAGLGNSAITSYTASADATDTWACINGGGKHPQASNKESMTTTVSNSGTFTSLRNGTITGSLTLSPPEPDPSSFSCPNGQTLVLASVSYTNVSITDTTNNVTEDIPGTYTAVFFNL